MSSSVKLVICNRTSPWSIRIKDVENAVSLIGMQVANLDTKLDRILGLLDGSK